MNWRMVVLCLSCSLITGWVSSRYTRSVVAQHLLNAQTMEQVAETYLIQARNVSAMLVANLEYQRTLKAGMKELRGTILAAMDPVLRQKIDQEERLTALEHDIQQILDAVQRLP